MSALTIGKEIQRMSVVISMPTGPCSLHLFVPAHPLSVCGVLLYHTVSTLTKNQQRKVGLHCCVKTPLMGYAELQSYPPEQRQWQEGGKFSVSRIWSSSEGPRGPGFIEPTPRVIGYTVEEGLSSRKILHTVAQANSELAL